MLPIYGTGIILRAGKLFYRISKKRLDKGGRMCYNITRKPSGAIAKR